MTSADAATHTLDALTMAVAVVDPVTWTLLYENSRFTEWFGSSGPDSNLADRLSIDFARLERASARLKAGRPWQMETEVHTGDRTVPVRVELRTAGSGSDTLIAEASSIARQKEAEYMLESYSRMAERQTRQLEKEKMRVERLLLNIMPRAIYEELRDSGTTAPQTFDSVSVLLLDFAGFTSMPIASDPAALISELNDIFTAFDRITEHFNCERIKTMGDAYMAVAGLPEPDPEHAQHLVQAAIRMRRFLDRRNTTSPVRWLGRIGIATGPVIGSIVGVQKYVYDVFGPAVNLASRLETLADPMQILVCAETREAVRNHIALRSAGTVDFKGIGATEVFAIDD